MVGVAGGCETVCGLDTLWRELSKQFTQAGAFSTYESNVVSPHLG
jgi:hypothetical protein